MSRKTSKPGAKAASKRLTAKEQSFVDALGSNPTGNARDAAIAAGYSAKTARIIASQLLAKDHIKQALCKFRDDRVSAAIIASDVVAARVMDGDEAMLKLSLYARADIGLILGPEHRISKLPPEVRLCIKSVRPTRYGDVVELHDSMRATELLAKAGGKLRDAVDVSGTLSIEQILSKSWEPAA